MWVCGESQCNSIKLAKSSYLIHIPIAWYGVKPLLSGVCNVLTTWFNSFLIFNNSDDLVFQLVSISEFALSQECFNWLSTSFLFALLECNCRQKRPRPICSRRRYTTSRAAIFSETNNTVFPFAIKCAIKLDIVWLLPVPGGPSITKLLPWSAAANTANWEESIGNGAKKSCGLYNLSKLLGSTKSPSSGIFLVLSSNDATRGCSIIASVLSIKSFHMRYLLKEKCPKTTSSTTSKPSTSFTAFLTMFHILGTSNPHSSVGKSPSNEGIKISKSCFNICNKVVLKRDSSSWADNFTPLWIDVLSSFTGHRIRGALYILSALSFLRQFKKPIAKYKVFEPPSSIIDLVFLYSAINWFSNLASGTLTKSCLAFNASFACSSHNVSPVFKVLNSASILVFNTFSAATKDIFTPSARKSSNLAGSGHNIARLVCVILQFNKGLLGDKLSNFFCQIFNLVASETSEAL